MTGMRWYTHQMENLPPSSRQRLTRQLMRSVRRGDLPSRREWRSLVDRCVAGR